MVGRERDIQRRTGKAGKTSGENLVTDDPWANRADVMLVRLILLETKNKFAKP